MEVDATYETKSRKLGTWVMFILLALILLALIFSITYINTLWVITDHRSKPSNECTEIETAILAYYTEYSVMPEAKDNRSLVKALTGDNPRKIEFITLKPNQLNAQGEMVDPWGAPYRISIASNLKIHVVSAGPDKIFGTTDDLPNH